MAVFWAILHITQCAIYGVFLGFFQVRTKGELFYEIVVLPSGNSIDTIVVYKMITYWNRTIREHIGNKHRACFPGN